jgi:hypothetical protein
MLSKYARVILGPETEDAAVFYEYSVDLFYDLFAISDRHCVGGRLTDYRKRQPMKIIISTVLASAALSLGISGTASAMPAHTYHTETHCTSSGSSYDPPMGVHVAENGSKWAGKKADGGVPESLVANGGSTTCEDVQVEDTVF